MKSHLYGATIGHSEGAKYQVLETKILKPQRRWRAEKRDAQYARGQAGRLAAS